MENPLCKIRDIQRALEFFESEFEKAMGLTLKEGMLLCCISEGEATSTELASKVDMSCSNCSKVIGTVEKKGYIQRMLGATDKRNMFFTLTDSGKLKLTEIKAKMPAIPDQLLGRNE